MSTFLNLAETIAKLSDGKYVMVKKDEWDILNRELKELKEKYDKLKNRFIKTSKNSSMPPSKNPPNTRPKSRRKRSGRKPGAQKGHKGHHRPLIPEDEVDELVPCHPPGHCNCGGCIESGNNPYRKQVFEIPKINIHVTEYQIYFGTCGSCGKMHKGELPPEAPKGNFGVTVQAIVSLLSGKYHLSQDNVVDLLFDLFGLSMCAGTVLNIKERVSDVLKAPYKEVKEYIQKAKQTNVDETGHKQNGKKMWLWLAATQFVAFFVITLHRGQKECKDILGESFQGFVTSDRCPAYNWLDVSQRQLCWAHLERDFVSLSEKEGEIGLIADKILSYIHQMFHLWEMLKADKIDRNEFKEKMKRIINRVELYLFRGREYKVKNNTCKSVYPLKDALWTFVYHEGIEPTNNYAEQQIRPYVIWRKLSFQTRSDWGNRFIERIMTVCSTCRLQDRNPLDFIKDALNANLKKGKSPSLLPEDQENYQKAA